MADDGKMFERINCELHNMLNSAKSIIGCCEDMMKEILETSLQQAKSRSRRGLVSHAGPSSSTSSSARIEEAQNLHRSEENPADTKRSESSLRGQKSDDTAAAPPKHDEPTPAHSKAEMEELLKMLKEIRKVEKMIRNTIISWKQFSRSNNDPESKI